MLITVPLGLLGTAVVFDLLDLLTDADTLAMAAFYMIVAGILGGLLAAVFGLWDWLAIPAGTRARRIGLWHGLGNAVVLVLFALVWIMRRGQIDYQPTGLALWLEGVAVLVALATAWAGGELVERLGVGVDEGHIWTLPAPCVRGRRVGASHPRLNLAAQTGMACELCRRLRHSATASSTTRPN